MRNLLRNRRGSAAFATVIALVPLIGAVALGGEAASWYVTKQAAQNAADAAAYSGALKLACTLSTSCLDTQTVAYRVNEFAAQNGFCNSGSTSYPGSTCSTNLPSGTSQAVTPATLTTFNGVSGNYVQATVAQTQPAYLSAVLGLKTVTISAQATAQIFAANDPCVLSLHDPLSFGGSTNVNGSVCGMTSNNSTSGSVTFTGSGNTVSGIISGQGGCSQNGSTNSCAGVTTYAIPTPDPLSALNTAMSSLTTGSFANGICTGSTPVTYQSGACYNTSLGSATLNGVYFFSGAIKINGNATITGTATLVLLPGSSLTITGNPTIQLTAEATVSSVQVPSSLSSVTSLMSDLLIYDPETGGSSNTVKISGNSTSYFNGIVYVPNSDVQYQGNNSTSSTSCNEVIAYGVAFTGSSTFNNLNCPASVKIVSQYVRLVQ